MPDDFDENGGEVSDAMSDNEYDDDDMREDPDAMGEANASSDNGDTNSGETKKKYDPKDPLRPKRKKARRACFACQRAHLTCGDERPCQRCVKRGLADACQDGVRKKAKYLHDAPPEALRPVLGPTYNPSANTTRPNGQRQHSGSASDGTSNTGSNFFTQSSTTTFPVYSGSQTPVGIADPLGFPTQTSPVSPRFPTPNMRQNSFGLPVNQVSSEPPMNLGMLFDPSNPALFNFDLESLNFGSQYGAMEFGMLGHMSGAAETPPRDNSISQASDVGFNPFGDANPYGQVYDSALLDGLVSGVNRNGIYSQGNVQHGLPHAYAIPAGPASLHSPSTDHTNSPRPPSVTFDSSAPGSHPTISATRPKGHKGGAQAILGKRQRDPSAIYENVKEPYPYTHGFHILLAALQKRFSSSNTMRIAKALGSIRPSFIACTNHLSRADLIFMEKCFQRTLFEYEDFMNHCSAPTIVCRRTGEVTAVNKEFTALTGWTKDVLLGKEPNQNVNSASDGPQERAGGLPPTPLLKSAVLDSTKTEGQPQAMFVAELLDDESVIQFYEDFAHLAFGDSRGSVVRKCRLVKYRAKGAAAEAPTSTETTRTAANTLTKSGTGGAGGRGSILSNRVTRIDGEHGISRIEKDGKVDCTFTWTLRQDPFDMPMLMIMNFLPCFYPNVEPHQLAI